LVAVIVTATPEAFVNDAPVRVELDSALPRQMALATGAACSNGTAWFTVSVTTELVTELKEGVLSLTTTV
jgi:hypothetical protein